MERPGLPRPPPPRPRGTVPRPPPNQQQSAAPRWACGPQARVDHPNTLAGPPQGTGSTQGLSPIRTPPQRGTPLSVRAATKPPHQHPTQSSGPSDKLGPSPTHGCTRWRDTPSQPTAHTGPPTPHHDQPTAGPPPPRASPRDSRRHLTPEPTPSSPPPSLSPQRGTGRQRSRKQRHPHRVSPTKMRRTRRAGAHRRPPLTRTSNSGDSPAPHPPAPPSKPHPDPTPTTMPARPDTSPSTPPCRRAPAPDPAKSHTVPTPPIPHTRYLARACKVRAATAPPQRQYAHTLTRGGGIRLGLGISDIPHAGWGVFALITIKVGAIVLDYSGPPRTKAWVENPLNDTRYVWGDENEIDALAAQGRLPVYIDAHPAVSTSWGGRVNDGFHRGAHLRAERVRGSDRVILRAIAPASADEELYLEYGGDYWQAHYNSLPPSVQAEARAHYDLTVIADICYTADQRRQAASEGRIHCAQKRWYEGPSSLPPSKRHHPIPPPPRLPPAPPPPGPTREAGPEDDLISLATPDYQPGPARPPRSPPPQQPSGPSRRRHPQTSSGLPRPHPSRIPSRIPSRRSRPRHLDKTRAPPHPPQREGTLSPLTGQPSVAPQSVGASASDGPTPRTHL